MSLKFKHSIVQQASMQVLLRITMITIFVGAISYFINLSSIETAVRKQLSLSTEQKIRLESSTFTRIKNIQRNFLNEFATLYEQPGHKERLLRDFDRFFYRRADGSYVQRPGIFEGQPLEDGRRFPNMSATYAPDIPPNQDTKIRMALSFLLSYKYGSSEKGELFNFYGVVPEKGFPNYQDADVSKGFSYSGPDALDLTTYEFYARGFHPQQHDIFFTGMYFDASNNAWMVTIATPGPTDTAGKRKIVICTDVVLNDLMTRTAKAPIPGAQALIFKRDHDGTLIYGPDLTDKITQSHGTASIRSLHLQAAYPILAASQKLAPGALSIVDTTEAIVAVGAIPETPWALAVMYPKDLMAPDIRKNVLILCVLGMMTLIVETVVIRSILRNKIASPLIRLIQAMRDVSLPAADATATTYSEMHDEIHLLTYEFDSMSHRVRDAHAHLEQKILERTQELETANQKLRELSITDKVTGISNRRHFDAVLTAEWSRGQRTQCPLALLLGDVDWFKIYNDTYGHQAGDHCLQRVARVLSDNAKRESDLVARYGGEEFAILLPVTNTDQAMHIAQTIIQALHDMRAPHSGSPFKYVTMSFGVAVMIPNQHQPHADLLAAADTALYAAKHKGRNQCVLWEAEL